MELFKVGLTRHLPLSVEIKARQTTSSDRMNISPKFLYLTNFPEQNHDLDDVNNFLNSINILNAVIKSTVRIGKPNKSGNRCLKVVFREPEQSQLVVHSKI